MSGGWRVAVLALALGVVRGAAAQGAMQEAAPVRAALARLKDAPPSADAVVTRRTLCEPQRCGAVSPAEGLPERSGLKTAALGMALGLGGGALLARDAPLSRAELDPIGAWDVALIVAGAYAWTGPGIFSDPRAPRLGEGRWSDCDGSRDGLGALDAAFRERLAGRSARTPEELRRALRRRETFSHWSDVALHASIAMPVGFALRAGGGGRVRDLTVYAEAGALSAGLTSLAKRHFRRPRPFAHYCEPRDAEALLAPDAQLSFVSGHTSMSFAVAIAGWRIAALRGERHARTLKHTSLALATVTGLLRVAADKHYLSDVVAGAALGVGSGWLVTELHEPDAGPPRDASAAAARARATFAPAGGVTLGLRSGLALEAGFAAGGPALTLRGRF